MSLVRADAVRIPLRDDSVDCVITSPPYFSLRSYRDGGEHFAGQIGSEPTPQAFLEALWAVTAECARVLKPSGSMFVNLGDKYAGSGGHNNAGLARPNAPAAAPDVWAASKAHRGMGPKRAAATRRQAPDRYNQSAHFADAEYETRAKSLMLLPERYRIGCVDRLGLVAREVLVWSKPNGLPDSARDRCRRSHEDWVHLSLEEDAWEQAHADWVHLTLEGQYFSATDEIREPSVCAETGRRADPARYEQLLGSSFHEHGERDRVMGNHTASVAFNPKGKLPGSVWTIPSEPLRVPAELGVDHFAAFPQEWPRRLILGWSPSGICVACGDGRRPVSETTHVLDLSPNHRTGSRDATEPDGNTRGINGERKMHGVTTVTGYACSCSSPTAPTRPAVVLDPFAGTGTTVMVATALGRFGVGLDLSNDYLRLARWRIEESGHASKSVRRTFAERNVEVPLFDATGGSVVSDVTVGVCGFARCGTTMVMRMLDVGGLPPVAGSAEVSYELPAPLVAARLPPAGLPGRAVKLLDAIRYHPLPTAHWRFIWLDRDPREQSRSAAKLLREFAGIDMHRGSVRELAQSYRRDRPETLDLLRSVGPVLELRYEDVLSTPLVAARAIADFRPPLPLDVDAMADAVHRRSPECRPDLAFELSDGSPPGRPTRDGPSIDRQPKELTMPDDDRHVRPFTEFLHEQRGGQLVSDLSDALNHLTRMVDTYGRKGTLTLTLTVSGKANGIVEVTDKVAVKAPEGDRPTVTYFVTEDANLSRAHPNQPMLPLREVPAGEDANRKDKTADA